MVTDIVNNQYPHYLYKRTADDEATQDANGSWVTQGGTWVLHSRCREETNGKGTQIRTAGGKYITFASLIQLPAGTERIPEGVEVAVAEAELIAPAPLSQSDIDAAIENGDIRVSGENLKFDKGRLHSRLWV